ncbi:MAG: DUF72 domain-containing protein [Candidatus Binataceae bacterium]|jgi:uncharacterized protein YecE (DUF72 family)
MDVASQIRIGTSGFSYKEWVGGFYPPKLPSTKMLAFYAERMPTVEINYTFRRIPRPEFLAGWAAQTPAGFRFALKAPERVTHQARLRNVGADLLRFAEAASAMGEKLGPVLFQLLPGFKRDVALLNQFLLRLGGGMRAVFEFRDASWFDDSVLEALRAGGAALCIAESAKLATPIERTARHVYVRLRNESYDDQSLRAWAERLLRFAADGAEVYVYFKHQTAAPGFALRMRDIVGEAAHAA